MGLGGLLFSLLQPDSCQEFQQCCMGRQGLVVRDCSSPPGGPTTEALKGLCLSSVGKGLGPAMSPSKFMFTELVCDSGGPITEALKGLCPSPMGKGLGPSTLPSKFVFTELVCATVPFTIVSMCPGLFKDPGSSVLWRSAIFRPRTPFPPVY